MSLNSISNKCPILELDNPQEETDLLAGRIEQVIRAHSLLGISAKQLYHYVPSVPEEETKVP